MTDAMGTTHKPTLIIRIKHWRMRTALAWGQFKRAWDIFRGNRFALIGLLMIGMFGIMAIAHPILISTVWPRGIYDPVTGFDMEIFPHPTSPSLKHLLGTDSLGRDVLSMLLKATTPTFSLGLTAAIATAVIGTMIGVISAYYGGIADSILSRVSDIFLLFPAPILMVVIGCRFRDIGSVPLGLIYGVVAGAGTTAVVMRSHALKVRVMPFIEASRIAGGGSRHVILKHVLPHMLPMAGLQMMIAVTGAVVADGFISFMGFTRNINNWGTIMYDAFTYAQVLGSMAQAWHVLIPSAVSLSFFAFAFYLVSRGMQDVADPRIVERRARERQTGVVLQLKRRLIKKPAPEIAVSTPSPMGTIFQLQPGRIVHATLLFAELHDISPPATSFQEKAVSKSPGKSFRDAIPIISQYGGLVSHIDGSSMVASFGIAPQRLPPQVSALLATHAGLELVDFASELNKSRSRQGLPKLKVSVGIATGLVRGQEEREKGEKPYSFRGNTVRTAQRLQQFTITLKAGGLLISEETYNFLKKVLDQFSFGRKGPAEFPWESEPKIVYEVLGRSQRLIQANWGVNRFPKIISQKNLAARESWLGISRR
ncbi:MAG TPA: ABC transporter permease subunit [Anaerolineae bacterium]|nr:ABC transporter permease subunit [Anaerolineae bacterium]